MAFLIAQSVKNLPAMQETHGQFLGQEDPLEREMATHSSTLAWKNPMDRGAWWAIVQGVTKSRTQLSDFTFTLTTVETKVLQNSTYPYFIGFSKCNIFKTIRNDNCVT